MAKPIIRYKPVATPDKVHHKMNYIPTIVDREDKIGLDRSSSGPSTTDAS